MATININQKNVSDNNNTFFRNNRIHYSISKKDVRERQIINNM